MWVSFSGRQATSGKRKQNGEKYKNHYYQCRGYYAYHVCSSLMIPAIPIETFVLDTIKKIVESGEYKTNMVAYLESIKKQDGQVLAGIKALRSGMNRLDREIVRIQDELIEIASKTLRTRQMKKEAEKEALEQKIKAA